MIVVMTMIVTMIMIVIVHDRDERARDAPA